MHNSFATGRTCRSLLLCGFTAAAAAILPSIAAAGECPPDMRGVNVREPVTLPAEGVTDTMLDAIDLASEPIMLADRMMRVRKLVIEPRGIVPWHSHADRPALIYILQGEIHEYASTCTGPIVHRAGEVSRETSEVSHWWKNLGDEPVILLAFDILHDKSDKHM